MATRRARRGAAAALLCALVAVAACVRGAAGQAAAAPPAEPVHRQSLDAFAVHATRLALDARVTLRVNATRLARSGAWVEVSWTFAAGAPRPSAGDVVAYYVPADADVTTKAPVKFQNATGATAGVLRCAPPQSGAGVSAR
jgi:hypothetical protein